MGATLVLVAGVAAALAGTGGTYALLTDSAGTAGATVRSGTATLTVSQLSATGATVLGPGSSTVGSFAVRNTGTVPLAIRVATTASRVSSAGTTAAVVLGAQRVTLAPVTSSRACRAGLRGTSGALGTFDTGSGLLTVSPGASSTACVEVALAGDAPQSVTGAVTDFTLTVTGTQVAP
ncbi:MULTISPECIES: hypothetical protein [unclassified Curtobacterium]|uniref:hypothetical protein n=1 Tax=unclassified Curtobacterium TaxID=257496 RepID=UPI0009F6356B|nr:MULTISPECIES: hypothetical protein [unclassified Curtobacterium]WIA96002.1 hypothetical protein QOL16_12920 [Curtobacterium sp. MCBA15_004]WIA99304.1 hypothetical protein QOL15_12335 [Curtobacterium sp. MCBA15_012]